MEFNFNCEQFLDCDENGIAILEGSYQNRIIPGYRIYVKEILDRMGEMSSKSQNLTTIITSTSAFFPSNYTLFLKARGNKVYGYLKIGPKKLFLRDRFFNYHERNTLCVLDFYVYETVQRQGIGKEIFDYMLKFERTYPDLLAYDRPSSRLLSFLKKNYRLDNYITQNNSFIIFDRFFSPDEIPNYDTEFDNETHRVIQGLTSPLYFKMNNNSYNNQTKLNQNRYNNQYYNEPNNNYRNNDMFNNKSYSMYENDNNHPKAMSPIGKQLIYSNDFTNSNIKRNYYNGPNSGFQNNRYQKDQYNNKPLFDEENENFNKNLHSQDLINEREYQNYRIDERKSPRKYSHNYRNQYNYNRQNDDYFENRRNLNNDYNGNI